MTPGVGFACFVGDGGVENRSALCFPWFRAALQLSCSVQSCHPPSRLHSRSISLFALYISLSLHLSPWLCSSNGSIDCLLNDLNASAESRQMAPPAEAGFCTGCLPRLCYPRLPFAGTGMEGKGKEERGVGVGMGKEGV